MRSLSTRKQLTIQLNLESTPTPAASAPLFLPIPHYTRPSFTSHASSRFPPPPNLTHPLRSPYIRSALDRFGHLAVIPSAEYYRDSLAALAELVRCGRRNPRLCLLASLLAASLLAASLLAANYLLAMLPHPLMPHPLTARHTCHTC